METLIRIITRIFCSHKNRETIVVCATRCLDCGKTFVDTSALRFHCDFGPGSKKYEKQQRTPN